MNNIIKEDILGNKSLTYFDFKFELENNVLKISQGEYWMANKLCFSYRGGEFELKPQTRYHIVIQDDDIKVIPHDGFNSNKPFLDKLAWGTIEGFHYKRIIEF
ncbi:hypothetical protein [Clostridium botulinum]|uniref:hypothetical protein n=1 Tax=Clostridium botulinum TaxID=1491 RepID=UPI0004D474C1|nr:hypothetical protein [Clostridium botulinum]KEH96190.1 hypothetical protein Z953_p0258 [Clostridium botulinum D str. 16868]